MKTTEMITVTEANIEISRTLKDERLRKATERIIAIYKQAAKYADEKNREIAKILAEISENEAYKADGFKSVAEYANTLFGINRQNAYALASAGKVYKNTEAHPTLKALSPSKIAELSGVDDKVLKDAIDNGTITAATTQKELREFANQARKEEPKKAKLIVTYTANIVGMGYSDENIAANLKNPRTLEEWDTYFTLMVETRHESPSEMVKLPNGKLHLEDKKSTINRRLYINQGCAIAVEFFQFVPSPAPSAPKSHKFTKAQLLKMLEELGDEEGGADE